MDAQAEHFADMTARIRGSIESVIDGQSQSVRIALTVFLAEGHVLIEDVPGVGKTVLAKSLAASVGSTVRRVQFTPDLMPSDITGVSVFHQPTGAFRFAAGPVFANIVIGDEINRASAKTQSALLEAMEERRVTVDGETHRLPSPFTVIATQNPVELEGTFPLPEAQRDRFMARISMGYPDESAELAMIRDRAVADPLDAIASMATREDVVAMIAYARTVFVAEPVERYALAIVRATRTVPGVRLGASPRATLQLLRAAKVAAAMEGRDFVLPDDVSGLAVPVLGHRLIPATSMRSAHESARHMADIVEQVVESTPVPSAV